MQISAAGLTLTRAQEGQHWVRAPVVSVLQTSFHCSKHLSPNSLAELCQLIHLHKPCVHVHTDNKEGKVVHESDGARPTRFGECDGVASDLGELWCVFAAGGGGG